MCQMHRSGASLHGMAAIGGESEGGRPLTACMSSKQPRGRSSLGLRISGCMKASRAPDGGIKGEVRKFSSSSSVMLKLLQEGQAMLPITFTGQTGRTKTKAFRGAKSFPRTHPVGTLTYYFTYFWHFLSPDKTTPGQLARGKEMLW